MSSAMMADIHKEDEFKVVEKRWHDKFEKEAVKIVDAQYDKKAIRGNKALEEVYENCIKLEVRKAIVYAIMGFTDSMVKEARKNVDEYTNKLGMAYSTLGWLHNHPDERPEKPAKKAKKESKAGSSSPGPRRRLTYASGSVTASRPCRRRISRFWRPSWTPTAASRPPWRTSRRKMLNLPLWTLSTLIRPEKSRSWREN